MLVFFFSISGRSNRKYKKEKQMKNWNLLCWNPERQTCACTHTPIILKQKEHSSLTLFGKGVKDVIQLCESLHDTQLVRTSKIHPKSLPPQKKKILNTLTQMLKFNQGEFLLQTWAWEMDHIQVEKCRTKTPGGEKCYAGTERGVRGIIWKWEQKKKTEGL